MTSRPAAGLLLIPFAAVCLAASACSRDPSGPGDALASPNGLRGDVCSGSTAPTGGTTSGSTATSGGTTTTGGTTTSGGTTSGGTTAGGTATTEDSVVSGYGSDPTGGIDYETFEYDPETGTESVATPDPSATRKELTPTTTGGTP